MGFAGLIQMAVVAVTAEAAEVAEVAEALNNRPLRINSKKGF